LFHTVSAPAAALDSGKVSALDSGATTLLDSITVLLDAGKASELDSGMATLLDSGCTTPLDSGAGLLDLSSPQAMNAVAVTSTAPIRNFSANFMGSPLPNTFFT
jgi:hypothetical protein